MVYPGVDVRFAALARRPDPEPFALVVGTVEARKNLLVLVDALAAHPELRIVSVGPHTPYAERVRVRAIELGVSDRLELRGYVRAEQLDDLYARAACALIPSRYEGFGYALAEAMCAGLPAIAARSSSLVEVAGGAVPLADPDAPEEWERGDRVAAGGSRRGAAGGGCDSGRGGGAVRVGGGGAADDGGVRAGSARA